MRLSIATVAIAAAALMASGALAENTVFEKRQKLAELWGKESATQSAPQAASVRVTPAELGERRHEHLSGPWADNWRGGRKHPPAGR